MFLVEYVSVENRIVSKRIPEFRVASEIARGIAASTGKSVKVRRVERDAPRWQCWLLDVHTSQPILISRGLSKRAARISWQRWNPSNHDAALMYWPENLPLPSYLVRNVSS